MIDDRSSMVDHRLSRFTAATINAALPSIPINSVLMVKW
jgi:hypothetical protein